MYNKVLTQEQADFAAEHHDLIFNFLNKRRLPEVDYYDVAVFGYLSAVKAYLAREDLREYAFSTIAFSRMRGSVGRQLSAEKKRNLWSCSYDEYTQLAPVEYDTPERICIRKEVTAEIDTAFSPRQKLVLSISAERERLHELCEGTGIKPDEITREFGDITAIAPELFEAIAA